MDNQAPQRAIIISTSLTADAIAVLDHFGIETADYVGLSLGGMTGLGLGLDHAERFNKIVCACARADNPAAFVRSWDDRIAAISNGGITAIWNGTVERWLTPDFLSTNADLVAQLASDFAQTTVAGYTGCARALQSLNYKHRLGDLILPTLFISGADDFGAPAAEMESMSHRDTQRALRRHPRLRTYRKPQPSGCVQRGLKDSFWSSNAPYRSPTLPSHCGSPHTDPYPMANGLRSGSL